MDDQKQIRRMIDRKEVETMTDRKKQPDWRWQPTPPNPDPNPAPAASQPSPKTSDDVLVIDTTPRQSAMDIKDGIYVLTLVAVDNEPSSIDEGKRCLVWKFTAEGQKGTLHFYSSISRGPRMEEALIALGVPFAKNAKTQIDKSKLIGRTCMGRVENVTTQRGGVFPRLKQLFPKVP